MPRVGRDPEGSHVPNVEATLFALTTVSEEREGEQSKLESNGSANEKRGHVFFGMRGHQVEAYLHQATVACLVRSHIALVVDPPLLLGCVELVPVVHSRHRAVMSLHLAEKDMLEAARRLGAMAMRCIIREPRIEHLSGELVLISVHIHPTLEDLVNVLHVRRLREIMHEHVHFLLFLLRHLFSTIISNFVVVHEIKEGLGTRSTKHLLLIHVREQRSLGHVALSKAPRLVAEPFM
mmetsp:Transcript_44864/g.118967  ORF Transcript_44864/g.118967 Transcript_44864/m.118967 type:complete len:236 (+) Transcript_44864:119-826(+)